MSKEPSIFRLLHKYGSSLTDLERELLEAEHGAIGKPPDRGGLNLVAKKFNMTRERARHIARRAEERLHDISIICSEQEKANGGAETRA